MCEGYKEDHTSIRAIILFELGLTFLISTVGLVAILARVLIGDFGASRRASFCNVLAYIYGMARVLNGV